MLHHLFRRLILAMTVAAVATLTCNYASARQSPSGETTQGSEDWLIVPGVRIGPIALGDPEEKIRQSFPRAALSQQLVPNCGTKYNAILLSDARHPGGLSIFVKDSKVVELESNEGSYHTSRGISSNSTAQQVQAHHHGLESYLYLLRTPMSMNQKPLVLWLGEDQGIGFTIVRGPRDDSPYFVHSIMVFSPHSSPCVEDGTFPYPQAWRKLAPYSLR